MIAGLKLVNHIGQATYHLKIGQAEPDSDQPETTFHVPSTATRLKLDFPTGTPLDIINESFQ